MNGAVYFALKFQPSSRLTSNSLDKHRFDQEITGNEKPSPINFPSIINTRLRE